MPSRPWRRLVRHLISGGRNMKNTDTKRSWFALDGRPYAALDYPAEHGDGQGTYLGQLAVASQHYKLCMVFRGAAVYDLRFLHRKHPNLRPLVAHQDDRPCTSRDTGYREVDRQSVDLPAASSCKCSALRRWAIWPPVLEASRCSSFAAPERRRRPQKQPRSQIPARENLNDGACPISS